MLVLSRTCDLPARVREGELFWTKCFFHMKNVPWLPWYGQENSEIRLLPVPFELTVAASDPCDRFLHVCSAYPLLGSRRCDAVDSAREIYDEQFPGLALAEGGDVQLGVEQDGRLAGAPAGASAEDLSGTVIS